MHPELGEFCREDRGVDHPQGMVPRRKANEFVRRVALCDIALKAQTPSLDTNRRAHSGSLPLYSNSSLVWCVPHRMFGPGLILQSLRMVRTLLFNRLGY